MGTRKCGWMSGFVLEMQTGQVLVCVFNLKVLCTSLIILEVIIAVGKVPCNFKFQQG